MGLFAVFNKPSVWLASTALVFAGITPSAWAEPSQVSPPVQVDANCGTVESPQACTESSLASSNTTRKLAVSTSGVIFALFYGPEGIRVSRSEDRGASFGPAIQVDPGSFEAEIGISADDTLFIVWNDGITAFIARSTDFGSSWTKNEVGVISTENSFNMTIHMAVDGEYVYLVSKTGNQFWVSSDSGSSFRQSEIDFGRFSSSETAWAYSDVLVDPLSHNVYVFVDDPMVSWFMSSDRGLTFGAEVETGKIVFFSVAAISSSVSSKYMYMSGGDFGDNVQNNLEQVNLIDTSAQVTRAVDASNGQFQGRSLAADGYGNIVAGAIPLSTDISANVTRSITFQVSNDFGESFGGTQSIMAGSSETNLWANVAINQTNGDLMYLYQVGDDIYFATYAGYLTGYDLELSVSSISLGFSGEVKSLVLTNSGGSNITLSNIGLDTNLFTFTSTCGQTLQIGASCTISVTGTNPGDDVLSITAANASSTVTKTIPVTLGALASEISAPAPQPGSTSSQVILVPKFDSFRGEFPVKTNIRLTGENLDQIDLLKLNGIAVRIISKAPREITIQVDTQLASGELLAEHGSHSQQGALFNLIQPIKVSLSGFAPGKHKLSNEYKSRIRNALNGKSVKSVTCTGFTSGPTVLEQDAALARSRAKAVCDFIQKSQPTVVTSIRVKTTTYKGAQFRKTELLITQ